MSLPVGVPVRQSVHTHLSQAPQLSSVDSPAVGGHQVVVPLGNQQVRGGGLPLVVAPVGVWTYNWWELHFVGWEEMDSGVTGGWGWTVYL